eukprot:751736-Hanusia_phi.AAC.3
MSSSSSSRTLVPSISPTAPTRLFILEDQWIEHKGGRRVCVRAAQLEESKVRQARYDVRKEVCREEEDEEETASSTVSVVTRRHVGDSVPSAGEDGGGSKCRLTRKCFPEIGGRVVRTGVGNACEGVHRQTSGSENGAWMEHEEDDRRKGDDLPSLPGRWRLRGEQEG